MGTGVVRGEMPAGKPLSLVWPSKVTSILPRGRKVKLNVSLSTSNSVSPKPTIRSFSFKTMERLKTWLRERTGSFSKSLKRPRGWRPNPTLPYLPDSPAPLPDNGLAALQNYGLFGKLPLELRRQILIEAFGGRTLHLDVQLALTTGATGPGQPRSIPVHPRTLRQGTELPSASEYIWRWRSFVCRRPSWYTDEQMVALIETCDDECRCVAESRHWDRTECTIGALGWLLACKQA